MLSVQLITGRRGKSYPKNIPQITIQSFDSVFYTVMAWSMLFNSLFYILTTQCAKAQSSSFRGNFIPPETTAALLEGDILVPESQVGRRPDELDAFLSDPELLWPNGYVPYCFETFEWEGSKEPIFLDDQLANVTKALGQISKDVPCIKFKWVTSKNKAENCGFCLNRILLYFPMSVS